MTGFDDNDRRDGGMEGMPGFSPAPQTIGDAANEDPVQEEVVPRSVEPARSVSQGGYMPRPAEPPRGAPQSGYIPRPVADIPPSAPVVRAPAPVPPKKKRGLGAIIAVALCCSLLGGIVGAGAVMLVQKGGEAQKLQLDEPTDSTAGGDKDDQEQAGSDTTILEGIREEATIDIVQLPTDKLLTAAEVYAANVNSTVGITTSITTNFWGFQSTSAASGSGSIISTDGYILTNYHVVEESDSITVAMYDETEYDAVLVGYDESNDIAVLKVEAEGLSPVILGDSDDLNVGDDVVAIGNPLGELTFTLTAGKVSAKDREVTFSNNVTMDLIQTDCAINSGNSGGALFNMYGEMIGITNAKYSGSSGSGASIDNIGFAIPVNSVWEIVESIIEKGYVTKPYLGVTVGTVSRESQMYGLPQGAAVQGVVEDSPAQKAGLQAGDIITHVGKTQIQTGEQLVDMVAECAPGDVMELTVYRKGQTLQLTATIEEMVQSAVDEGGQR